MAKIGDASHLNLSELVNRLNLEHQTGTKELRSTGTNLYVKDGKALFTNVESRASHQRDAVAVVRNALAQEYGLTQEEANRVMADVLGESPMSITADDVMRLHGGAEEALHRLPREESSSESGTLVHDQRSRSDSVSESRSSGLNRSESVSHEESSIPTAPPFDAPPLDLPPPPPLDGPPPPPPMGVVGGASSWKKDLESRISDQYGEMVLAKDITKPDSPTYKKGMVPTTEVEFTCHEMRVGELSVPDQQMVGIGKEVLAQVRSYLPKGPFNNYGNLPKAVVNEQRHPVTGKHNPAWWNQVVDASAEKALTQLKKKYPDVPEFKLAAACLARATREVGGGVCSKMATLTASVLMEKLPPGSEIAQVFSSYDHEFCIAKLPGENSNWFVVDPWCHEPDVLPFSDCYFGPESIKGFYTINVTKPTPEGMPFGIDVETGVDWGGIVKDSIKNVEVTQKDMAHVFGQVSNVKSETVESVASNGRIIKVEVPLVDVHDDFHSVGKNDWG